MRNLLVVTEMTFASQGWYVMIPTLYYISPNASLGREAQIYENKQF
jgi:hypothetical protein